MCLYVSVCRLRWLRLSVYRYHQQAPHADEHTHTDAHAQNAVKGVRTVRACVCVCMCDKVSSYFRNLLKAGPLHTHSVDSMRVRKFI